MIRVLHVLNGERFAGPERVVAELCAGAQATEPSVVTLLPGSFAERTGIPATLIRSRARLDPLPIPTLVRLVRGHRIDVIDAHTPRAAFVGRVAGRLTGRPVVTHVHSPAWAEGEKAFVNRARAAIDDATAPLSARFVAVSDWLGAALIDRGYPRDRVVVCRNGVPLPAADARAGPEPDEITRLGLRGPSKVIGMYAMFRERKGADVLLRAFARSTAFAAGARLLLVGGGYPSAGGTYVDTLKSVADDLGIASACIFAGEQPRLDPWFRSATIAVVPSLYGEGLPMVLLELLAAGVPTIATRIPGVEEVATAAAAPAFALVPPGDVEALASAMDALLDDKPRRERMASAGPAVAARYSTAAMVSCTEAVYLGALGA